MGRPCRSRGARWRFRSETRTPLGRALTPAPAGRSRRLPPGAPMPRPLRATVRWIAPLRPRRRRSGCRRGLLRFGGQLTPTALLGWRPPTGASARARRARARSDLQRDFGDHLPDSSFDPVQIAENHLSRCDPVRGPAFVALHRFQDHLEAVGQVGDNVIAIGRSAMIGIEDRTAPPTRTASSFAAASWPLLLNIRSDTQ
jgi:hypothetical protein